MNAAPQDESVDEDLDPAQVRVWAEFCAWCAFVMTPIIWWLQGPSVSTDQAVVRTGLLVLSLVVGLSLRIWAIVSPPVFVQNAQKTAGTEDAAAAHTSGVGSSTV